MAGQLAILALRPLAVDDKTPSTPVSDGLGSAFQAWSFWCPKPETVDSEVQQQTTFGGLMVCVCAVCSPVDCVCLWLAFPNFIPVCLYIWMCVSQLQHVLNVGALAASYFR